MAYDEELRAYLKATGLTASDLVKPKPKKKDPRAAASSSHHLLQQQQHARVAANGSSPATALSGTGQQLVQSLIGLQPQHNDGLGNASAAQAGTEGWTAQAAQQVSNVFSVLTEAVYFLLDQPSENVLWKMFC